MKHTCSNCSNAIKGKAYAPPHEPEGYVYCARCVEASLEYGWNNCRDPEDTRDEWFAEGWKEFKEIRQ